MADRHIIKLFLGEQDGDSYESPSVPEDVIWVSDYDGKAMLRELGGVVPVKLQREIAPLRYSIWETDTNDEGDTVHKYVFEPEPVKTE